MEKKTRHALSTSHFCCIAAQQCSLNFIRAVVKKVKDLALDKASAALGPRSLRMLVKDSRSLVCIVRRGKLA